MKWNWKICNFTSYQYATAFVTFTTLFVQCSIFHITMFVFFTKILTTQIFTTWEPAWKCNIFAWLWIWFYLRLFWNISNVFLKKPCRYLWLILPYHYFQPFLEMLGLFEFLILNLLKYFKFFLKNWAPKNNLRKTSLFSIINIHQLRQKIHGLGGLQNQLITQRSYAEYAASVANAIQ